MNIYENLGLKTIVNASDTYTRIGGSRMSENVLSAMCEAGRYFVDIVELNKTVSHEIATMTQNEAAFISSGGAACVVITASCLMVGNDFELASELPDTSRCSKNEIIVFENQTKIPMLPYWHLIELSGAKLVKVGASLDELEKAVCDRTAGMYFFAADVIYEEGLPPLKDVISLMHTLGVPIIVDAAAQLPPKSNLWYYTRDLGANGVIFSGGKFLAGPQSTGLFLGDKQIADRCYAFANPNVSIGRPYKVGKEEFIGIYTAMKEFIESDAEAVKRSQNKHLDLIEKSLLDCKDLQIRRSHQARLAQDAPMLIVDLPEGKTGADCSKFMLESCNPAIDIGHYLRGDDSGMESQIFINSINLRDGEPEYIAEILKAFLKY